MSNRQRLSLAKELALKAGKVLKEAFYGSIDIRYKSEVDPVTNADMESERLILSSIADVFSEDIVVAEESTANVKHGGNFWLVDPLDGTVNFSHKLQWFSVSIAYVENWQVKLGVVYCPMFDWLFTAFKGEGATFNSSPIHVSDKTEAHRAIIATGFPYDRITTRTNFAEHDRVISKFQDVRRMGSACIDICLVAQGVFDGYYEYGLGPWDFAAASIIAEEAGAVSSKPDGSKVDVLGSSYLCANHEIHQLLVATIANEK